MTDLSPEAKVLLDLSRDGDEMPASDKGRHRAQLLAHIAVASAAGVGASLAVKTASASAGAASAAGGASTATAIGGISLLTKVVGAVALAGVVASGAAGVRSFVHQRPAASVPVSIGAPAPVFSPTAPRESRPESTAAPAADPAPTDTPRSHERTTSPKPASAPASSGKAHTPSLEEETQWLRAAQQALQSGDASRALSMLDEHARVYPHGVLVEERGAQRIFALCALGSTARARAEAVVFLAERPNSPLAPRVRASCIAK